MLLEENWQHRKIIIQNHHPTAPPFLPTELVDILVYFLLVFILNSFLVFYPVFEH